jgi:fructokinase
VVESCPRLGDQSFTIPRPAAFESLDFDPPLKAEAESPGIDWIYLGTLLQTNPQVERFTTDLICSVPSTRVFYDLNLRDGHWNLALVQRLSRLASVAKLNEAEAERLFKLTHPGSVFDLQHFCAWWAEFHEIDVLCVTLGQRGSLIFSGGTTVEVPAFCVETKDTVGAGDAFAAAFLYSVHHSCSLPDAARFANALGAVVASQAGATPQWTIQQVLSLMPPGFSNSPCISSILGVEELRR